MFLHIKLLPRRQQLLGHGRWDAFTLTFSVVATMSGPPHHYGEGSNAPYHHIHQNDHTRRGNCNTNGAFISNKNNPSTTSLGVGNMVMLMIIQLIPEACPTATLPISMLLFIKIIINTLLQTQLSILDSISNSIIIIIINQVQDLLLLLFRVIEVMSMVGLFLHIHIQ